MHFPKTAGTWLRGALRNATGLRVYDSPCTQTHSRHCGMASWEGKMPDLSFTCLREPRSWVESWFRYNTPDWTWWQSSLLHPCRWSNHLIDNHPDARDNFRCYTKALIEDHTDDFNLMYERAVDRIDRVFKFDNLAGMIDAILDEASQTGSSADVLSKVKPENVSKKMKLDWDNWTLAQFMAECDVADKLYQEAE